MPYPNEHGIISKQVVSQMPYPNDETNLRRIRHEGIDIDDPEYRSDKIKGLTELAFAETEPDPDVLYEVAADNPDEIGLQTIIPYGLDKEEQWLFLGYLATGFTVRQSLALVGTTWSSLRKWRKNQAFVDAEKALPNIVKEWADKIMENEIRRNMRMIHLRDFIVLRRAATAGLEILSDREFKYLMQIRKQYGPEQLIAMTRLTRGEDNGPTNYTEFVLEFTKTQMRVRRHASVGEVLIDTTVQDADGS